VHGAGAADVTCATATFARREKSIAFEQNVRVVRGQQTTEAADAVAHLSADESRIETVELHGGARIGEASPAPGALRGLSGRDMTLAYAANGESLEHAVISGTAAIEVAGDAPTAGRQIAGNTIDVTLAPDGSTPTALTARDAVRLTLPAEQGAAARTVRANAMDARGEADRGLTSARFTGNVDYRETGGAAERAGNGDAP